MVRRGRREETKSMCMPETQHSQSGIVWLVWILPLGRINCVRRQTEKGSWAMSEHLIHCMDQLIYFLAVSCGSITGFKAGGEVAHLKLVWLYNIYTSIAVCGTHHLFYKDINLALDGGIWPLSAVGPTA